MAFRELQNRPSSGFFGNDEGDKEKDWDVEAVVIERADGTIRVWDVECDILLATLPQNSTIDHARAVLAAYNKGYAFGQSIGHSIAQHNVREALGLND